VATLDHAIIGLEQALERPSRHEMWRWLVRHRVNGVREALARETTWATEAWLAARELNLSREREILLRKLERLGTQMVEATDVEAVRRDIRRVLTELERHRQRLNDLVYDTVSLELGGSD